MTSSTALDLAASTLEAPETDAALKEAVAAAAWVRANANALISPAEVAAIFAVDPKTVTRWDKTGKLTSFRTPGGHRRYSAVQVRALLLGSFSGGQVPPVTVTGEVEAA